MIKIKLENDLLYSIAGALGRVAIVNKSILPANTNQALSIIRLKDKSKVKYIYYYLNSPYIKNHIDKVNVQNAQANLSLQNIKNTNTSDLEKIVGKKTAVNLKNHFKD